MRQDNFNKILGAEHKLVLFIAYVGSLIFLLLKGQGWFSVLYSHLIFVFIFSIFYFGREFLSILISPAIAISLPINNYLLKRYLRNFKQNTPASVVIVLAHSNWLKLEAWVKPNFFVDEIKSLVKYLEAKKQDFSFYTAASSEEVEKIMSNKKIKEVYFFGHGSSHIFQLSTDDILYYCDFNDPKYGKEFVHQIHCGTSHGKGLVDYVVPEENRAGCFWIKKSITGPDIKREFKRRTKNLKS